MSDLLNNGVSALTAYRRALETVSHNIANVSTPGYSRQQTDLQARPEGGVEVRQVTRLSDAIVFSRSLTDNSSFSRLDNFQQVASRVDTLLSNADTGLTKPLQNFFAATDAVASDPSSTAARQGLIAAGNGLASQFKDLQGELNGVNNEINSRVHQAVVDVNNYTTSIADLNSKIVLAQRSNSNPPNDLIDQRDQLITELSSRVGVTTVNQGDGTVNVLTSGGQALVLGNKAQQLSLVPDAYNSGRTEIAIGDNKINVTKQLTGGLIGGLMDARTQVVDPAQASLGRIAAALAQGFNSQNTQGADLRGNLGGNFFTQPAGAAFPATANTGSAEVAVGYQNSTQLTGDNYILSFDGAAWQMKNAATGSAVALSGAGTAASPLVGAGISLQLSGSAAAGDSFRIEPTRSAAGQLAMAISDPAAIAAATPVRAQPVSGNTGGGSIAAPTVLDATNPNLQSAVTIQFTSASSYSINGAGSYAYNAGGNIDVNGWRVAISGAPAAGDSFQVRAAAANSSDNGNARLMSGLSSKQLLDGGRSTLSAANTSLVSQNGSVAQQAQFRRDAQQAILTQTQKERDSVSGVNLDQEAADLLRFQQAYQAAAQMMQTANSLFQSLLAVARG